MLVVFVDGYNNHLLSGFASKAWTMLVRMYCTPARCILVLPLLENRDRKVAFLFVLGIIIGLNNKWL